MTHFASRSRPQHGSHGTVAGERCSSGPRQHPAFTTTECQLRPKLRPPRTPQNPREQVERLFPLVNFAEAEGFEPPVPFGTLAFKVVDPLISSDHPNSMGRSSARA
jgi:hypothetical protein